MTTTVSQASLEMFRLHTAELPYPEDVQGLFAAIAHRPWAMWLDSSVATALPIDYDILVSDPYATLLTQDGVTEYQDGDEQWRSREDPFSLLRSCLSGQAVERHADIPFAGGALGVFSYDLARCIETLPEQARDDLHTPQMMLGLYDWAVVVDHRQRRCRLVSWQTRAQTAQRWEALQALFNTPVEQSRAAPLRAVGKVATNMDKVGYALAFGKIQRWLHEGDCYQVNFAQRFAVAVEGDPFSSYCRLRRQSPAPFGAYLNTPHGQILCNSPERFLRVREGEVETSPIKGTRPRGEDPQQDKQLRDELQQSAKDRAENVMIVDLLRNDLAKSCRPGSIRVPELFQVQSYATVHQLVSRVNGVLRGGEDALSLLRHCFPGGSITGAPKLRAMQIIESLEPQRRGIYCGAIGYLGFDGNMDSNIVIRTALHRDGRLWYSAGGGIVSDSQCEAEYREIYHKAAAFFRMLDLPTAI